MKQLNNKTTEEPIVDDLAVTSLETEKHLVHHHHPIFIWVALVWALGAALLLFAAWAAAENSIEQSGDVVAVTPVAQLSFFTPTTTRAKPLEQTVKAVYLTAFSAGSDKKLDEIIRLINETELNAVVIDIKDYSGMVLYTSQVPLIKKLKLSTGRLGNVRAMIDKLHRHNIYVIARQTVFQDPVLAAARPEWAIKDKFAGLWRDKKGLTWVDPTRKEVWDYNIAIAREAVALGFDEINFDYVRFPSDGNMSRVVYATNGRTKASIMREFYEYLGNKLASEPAWLSLDMFGLTMEATSTNDMNIGQRIADAVDYTDYISPMMYPSHYPRGHLGLKNPADNPAAVIKHGMELGLPKFVDKRTKLRPWIQAFNLGAVYDAAKIRAQINEIEKVSNSGWMMWNASNRYTASGLKSE